jgi:hypothetical protein
MGMNGFGTTLGYADTSNGSPTLLGNILKITPAKGSVKDVTYTPLDSADKHAIHLPGSMEGGEVSLNLPYGKTLRNTLEGLKGVSKFWTITLPDSATFKCEGYIAEIGEEEIAPDSLLTTALKIQISGKPTFTAGS